MTTLVQGTSGTLAVELRCYVFGSDSVNDAHWAAQANKRFRWHIRLPPLDLTSVQNNGQSEGFRDPPSQNPDPGLCA
ncbi:hypothetical protein CC2G_007677 [Coprinopsis cinerea AmutBmut pab1-1]|nr:hypothetical protein CC2G_007677 [Coprinopsis cinerea AmutBmut pab1-1]